MDEKTEQLRDIFQEVSETDTVTETQQETPGTLSSAEAIDADLEALIEEMRSEYEFRTEFSTAQLRRVVRGFFDGSSDAAIAADLEGDPDSVGEARIDLQLVQESDTELPFDRDEFEDGLESGLSTAELAQTLETEEATVERARHVHDAQAERRLVTDRYYDEFEALVTDKALSEQLTDDGGREAIRGTTDGQEVDVSF